MSGVKTLNPEPRMFGIGYSFFIRRWNNLRSGATSLFDVRRSMFDVGRSSFNMFDVHLFQSLLGKNNLALMVTGRVLSCRLHTDAPFSILASKLIAIDIGFAKAIEIAFL